MKQVLQVRLLVLLSSLAKAAKLHQEAVSCDSFQCNLEQGWAPRPNRSTLPGNSIEKCCRPTCKRWTCSKGYKAHPDYYNNVASSNSACCDRLCSTVPCNASFGVPTRMRNVPGKTHEECCKPLCSQHLCFGSWAPDPRKAHQAGSSNEECCTASCAALACDASKGYKYFLERYERAQPAKNPTDFCCQKTCPFYQEHCGEGRGMNLADESKMSMTVTERDFQNKCCEPKCSSVKCQAGYILDPTFLNYLVSKIAHGSEGCCLPTCKAFECPAGWMKYHEADNFVSPYLTKDDCCLPTCAVHKCGKGWFTSTVPTKLAKVSRSDRTCCEPSCAAAGCAAGLVLKPNAFNISSGSTCCEPEMCQELRSKRQQVKYCNSVAEEAKCNMSYDVHDVNR
ncbi:unnamed protein product [Durusdinium trenchii]